MVSSALMVLRRRGSLGVVLVDVEARGNRGSITGPSGRGTHPEAQAKWLPKRRKLRRKVSW